MIDYLHDCMCRIIRPVFPPNPNGKIRSVFSSPRQWRSHEVEMVEVVADQVAVALSHAAALEESQRRRDELAEQNEALKVARQSAEVAVRARNDFLTVMNHELRTPLHTIVALSSLLKVGGAD